MALPEPHAGQPHSATQSTGGGATVRATLHTLHIPSLATRGVRHLLCEAGSEAWGSEAEQGGSLTRHGAQTHTYCTIHFDPALPHACSRGGVWVWGFLGVCVSAGRFGSARVRTLTFDLTKDVTGECAMRALFLCSIWRLSSPLRISRTPSPSSGPAWRLHPVTPDMVALDKILDLWYNNQRQPTFHIRLTLGSTLHDSGIACQLAQRCRTLMARLSSHSRRYIALFHQPYPPKST